MCGGDKEGDTKVIKCYYVSVSCEEKSVFRI